MQFDFKLPLPAILKAIRQSHGSSIIDLSKRTGLSRLTTAAAEGKSDPRLSTLAALFDSLGYALVPVPKQLVPEVERFINNGGVMVSVAAGAEAPVSPSMAHFEAAKKLQGDGGL
ncbi:transcriptional regulator with XRE-family HTH domain [Roseateles asaccharophilus]|uniref:helix-turn-helix domain-containing protein n=1 Tax=Roseateles asaccharophilus TaxID=582607 RepID=UPI0038395BF3